MVKQRRARLESVLKELEEQAVKVGAQVVCVVAYPNVDEQGVPCISSERLLHVDSHVDENTADILVPLVRFLEVYFGDRPPTREDVSMLMDIMLKRKFEAMEETDIAEIMQRMRDDHDCENCDDRQCPSHSSNIN